METFGTNLLEMIIWKGAIPPCGAGRPGPPPPAPTCPTPRSQTPAAARPRPRPGPRPGRKNWVGVVVTR